MLDYNFVIDQSIQKNGTIIPETTLHGYTNREPKNVLMYQKIINDDIEGTGKIKLTTGTHLLYKKIQSLSIQADKDMQRGRDQKLSGGQMKELKKGISVRIMQGVEDAKRTRREQLFKKIEDIEKREKAGNGLNSTEQLLRFQRTQLEASAMSENEAGILLQKYEKDPLQAVNRDMVLYFMANGEKAIKKKAQAIYKALPAGMGMSVDMKNVLSELVSLNAAGTGSIQLVRENGIPFATISAVDLMAGNSAEPTAQDILNSK